ncbi:MAG: YebC/PmpR family DNA-binding transcriptional regulator [Bacteroidota bacterium]
MAGHSKWANIKHRKSANDAKKGKLFGKLVKEITAAAKIGGPAPESNARLRLAIQNAKGANVPKNNIERAIKKGSGADAADYTEVTYEGHGPYGVAVVVECMTDNLNRTVAAVRAAFAKYNGSLGKSGSLAFIFNRQGVFRVPQQEVDNEESLTLAMIEAGAAAIESEETDFYITCALEAFGRVQQALETLGIMPAEAGLQYIPTTSVPLAQEDTAKVMKLIDTLEDHDDVQRVYHNAEGTAV